MNATTLPANGIQPTATDGDADAIRVVTAHDPFVDHMLSWLSDLIGRRFERSRQACAAAPSIEYSASRTSPNGLWIPRRQYSPASPPPIDLASLHAPRANQLMFDFFEATRFWLTDAAHVNAPDDAFDRHDRLTYSGSIFSHLKIDAVPIVNHYVAALRRAIETTLSIRTKPLWPAGRKACVILTHDVDAPLDPDTPATKAHLSRIRGESWLSRLRSGVRSAFRKLPANPIATSERHWLFREIMDAEARHDFRSTFFFAPRHCGMPGADPAHDVRYDIADRSFQKLFPELTDRGFEIALHASYNVHRNHALLAEEIDRLERFARARVRGVRHHYWRLGRDYWPTLAAHADAGLQYDASIAFNESPGFRWGVALPVPAWSPKSHRPINTIQLPTMLMDGAVFYRPGAVADDGVRIANTWVDHLVNAGGCGAIDWHVRTSFPGNRRFAEWGRSYLQILDMLASRSDVHVTNCAGLIDHLADRSAG